ncbi:M14-type cytosolic carboxypeptidase [Singulisphaera sp. Ch08]|uniref:M14-type cytosolic carboxypeptidase n=1 Tax=Singulisphaera sp. Ch08 TaxID=3120278 RepID=A0AAU7C9M0_9BACT
MQVPLHGLFPRLAWATFAAAWMLALAGAAPEDSRIRFSTNFEGGSLGTIEAVSETEFRCHVKGQQDEHGRNRQASWFSFRIDGARGRDLTIVMTDFVGEYNEKPGACPMGPEIIPVFSNDGVSWSGIPDVSWDERTKEATLRIRPERNSIWIAHQQPYTPRQLSQLLEQVDRADDARIEVIGRTAQGRDLHLVTVTSEDVPDRDKVTVWLQARQHAWESGTSYVMEGALRFVTSDDPKALALRKKAIFKFTPMVDPDGSATGQVRFNANGFDVNRHWDEVDLRRKRDLRLMPEIWYVKKAISSYVDTGRTIDLMVNLHNTETGEYIQTHAGDDAARARVVKFSDRLIQETAFQPSHGPILGAKQDGTANVLHAQKGILIMLMELRIAKDPRTGKPPTAADRLDFGTRLIQIMAESVIP